MNEGLDRSPVALVDLLEELREFQFIGCILDRGKLPKLRKGFHVPIPHLADIRARAFPLFLAAGFASTDQEQNMLELSICRLTKRASHIVLRGQILSYVAIPSTLHV